MQRMLKMRRFYTLVEILSKIFVKKSKGIQGTSFTSMV